VNDFQKQLASPWIENENSSVDWLCGEVAFMSLVNSNTVDVCVIDKPNDLV
jgi:hypothetical protein